MLWIKIVVPILFSVLPLQKTNWKNETHRYQVSLRGNIAGFATHHIERSKYKGKPIYTFLSVNDIKTEKYSFVDTSLLRVNVKDLTPIHSERAFIAKDYSMRVQADYEGNKAKLSLTSVQGNNNVDVDLPEDTYDNDEILFLLRAFNFSKPETLRFNVLSLSSGKTVPVIAYLMGKEKIKALKGKKVKTYHLRIDYQGEKQHKTADIYYEQKKGHKFIKYSDPTTGLEIDFVR